MSRNSPFKTPEFQKLFAEWNQKLKEDGFKDAEDFTLPEPMLVYWHNYDRFKSQDGRESYYAIAQRLLHDGFKFESDLSRRVWELHSQGKSVRQIEALIAHQLIGYKGCKRDAIHRAVLDTQRKSGIKTR